MDISKNEINKGPYFLSESLVAQETKHLGQGHTLGKMMMADVSSVYERIGTKCDKDKSLYL